MYDERPELYRHHIENHGQRENTGCRYCELNRRQLERQPRWLKNRRAKDLTGSVVL